MPTVLRSGPYRFFFYASDGWEPRHIHVERDDKIAKYWLTPIRLEYSIGFNRLETRRMRVIIAAHHLTLLEAWNEYFGQ